jgi:hypothetical protein
MVIINLGIVRKILKKIEGIISIEKTVVEER